VVNGLLWQGEVCNLIAKSKVGKSWTGYSLGLSVVTGSEWLLHFRCTKGRVLLIDDELHVEDIAHRIPSVAEAMCLQPADYRDQFDVLPLRGDLRSIHELGSLFTDTGRGKYALVIIDALYRMLPDMSENDNAAMAGVYNAVDRYAAMTDAAFVLIHHASKGSQSDKDVTDVGAGAGSQSRAADTHLILRPHEEESCVVLDAAVRSWPPVKPLALRWEFPVWVPDCTLDPSELKGRLTAREQQQNTKDADDAEKIVAALKAGPATARALRPKTGISKDRLGRLLDKMEHGERIVTKEKKLRGNACREYRLP
jgi:hypothetical protein